MVTGSEPAGRKTSAKPHASAAAPITTASASRTAERGDRITETPADKGSLQIGEGDPDGNSVAHAVGQALAPPSIVPIAAAAEVPKFLRAGRTKYSNRSTRGHPMRAALRLALMSLLVATRSTTAQETPTEKTAAADVIRRMNELERSLALPPLVARLTVARDARRDAVIARAKDLMDRELLVMADDITRHPETGWKEERSVKILTDYLTAHGFDIEPGVAGLKTAFVARYRKGTPGPNLGVIVEYDALRGTSRDFHGDQHSAQGPVGLAAAVAVAEFLTSSKTPGTVTVFGAPAHQLQAWDGRDAMMGVIELFNNIDGLRKTVRPETKIKGIITEGGKA